MIDAIDAKILTILQQDARIPNSEIAKMVGLVPSATSERIKKLSQKGLIHSYETRLNAQSLGFGLVAFIRVLTDEPVSGIGIGDQLAKIAEVQEVHNIAGEDCYLVKVRVKDAETLSRFLREKIGAIKAVKSTRTTIAMETFKETISIPVETERPGS